MTAWPRPCRHASATDRSWRRGLDSVPARACSDVFLRICPAVNERPGGRAQETGLQSCRRVHWCAVCPRPRPRRRRPCGVPARPHRPGPGVWPCGHGSVRPVSIRVMAWTGSMMRNDRQVPARPGCRPSMTSGKPKLGVVAGNPVLAGKRQFQAAAKTVTVDQLQWLARRMPPACRGLPSPFEILSAATAGSVMCLKSPISAPAMKPLFLADRITSPLAFMPANQCRAACRVR